MAIRKKEGENLSEENIEKVKQLLNSDNPISKKEACGLLNIAYSVTRLAKIIDEYTAAIDYKAEKRKRLQNTPISPDEVKYFIDEYLAGTAMETISDMSYRSIGVIKRTLEKYNIPTRNSSVSYSNPLSLEGAIVREDYKKGDLVFSARYNCPATIEKLSAYPDKGHGPVYLIWVYGDGKFALQPYYELADLTEVQKQFNIKIAEMTNEEIQQALIQARIKAKKATKERERE